MSYTTSSFTLAQAVFSALDTDKAALGLSAVYYGEQNKFPVTPVAVVEPGSKSKLLSGAPYRVTIQFTTYVIIFNDMLTDKQSLYEATDELAETVNDYLDGRTYGGIVIFSYVQDLDPGYSARGGTLYRANRLSVVAQSLQQLTKKP